ncbi:hypothetical protein [Paenibacillus polymyxa]|uniref:hypothetical protein n=1 Tax=Paenibacillus polymyxa TaxID=1406 RepID=UPI0032AFC895
MEAKKLKIVEQSETENSKTKFHFMKIIDHFRYNLLGYTITILVICAVFGFAYSIYRINYPKIWDVTAPIESIKEYRTPGLVGDNYITMKRVIIDGHEWSADTSLMRGVKTGDIVRVTVPDRYGEITTLEIVKQSN